MLESVSSETVLAVKMPYSSSYGKSLRGCECCTVCGLFLSCSHAWSLGANGLA